MAASSESFANHLVLHDVSWESYTRLLEALGDRRLRHAYDRGTLEMMSPSEKHESLKRFIGRLIETASLECGMSIRSVGSATQRRKALGQGLEPDESYYIAPAGRRKSAPPDLVVEIDLGRTQIDRLESYGQLGVREVWRYCKGAVEFFERDADRQMAPVARSAAFSMLAS